MDKSTLRAAKMLSARANALYEQANSFVRDRSPKFLKSADSTGLEKQLLDGGVLGMRLRYAGARQAVSDNLVALIEDKGEGNNDFDRRYEWYAVSVDNPEFEGSDLYLNTLPSDCPENRKGYIRYFNNEDKVVVIKDHIRSWFACVFDNWRDYAEQKCKKNKNSNIVQRDLLMHAGLSDLKRECRDKMDEFVEKASKRYAESFAKLQEAQKVKSIFSSEKEKEAYAVSRHMLDASIDMKYILMADIIERAASPFTVKGAKEFLREFIQKVGSCTLKERKDMTYDISVLDDAADHFLRRIKGGSYV